MNFEWLVPRLFQDTTKNKYINECCAGGDEVLQTLKSDLASEMNINVKNIEIYQEDWGWALEFTKKKVVYFLAVSNCGKAETGKTIFNAYTEATRKEKVVFFSKNVCAKVELDEFSGVVSKLTGNYKWQTD